MNVTNIGILKVKTILVYVPAIIPISPLLRDTSYLFDQSMQAGSTWELISTGLCNIKRAKSEL